MSDFLAMGGYGFYVWGSYAATALVFGWNLVVPRLQRRALRRALRGAEAERP
ncbi:MAG: heme exporter protein CcmD [Nevskiaceae bacterium]